MAPLERMQRERELIHGEHQVIRRSMDRKVDELPADSPARTLPGIDHGTFWQRHGELICAITAGVLLLGASIYHWTTGRNGADYYIPVSIAFALGFFYGAAEAWESLREGKLDIHFLMVAGAVMAIFVGAATEGAVLLFLFTLSGALEEYAMQRTHAALESLMKLFPQEAVVLEDDGTQRSVKLEELKVGWRVLVKPGENVAADGTIVDGVSAIDESAITGEYMPREKGKGATVYAGTLNKSGRLVVQVDKPAHDTTLAKIIHLVSEAREEKAPVEQLFDRIGTAYTIGVLTLSVVTCLVLGWFFNVPWVGHEGAIYRAITLLIVASPCALIISTPVVLLSAIASCARRGIVLKGGRHLESVAALKALVFDKTGTLTSGQIRLVGVEHVPTGPTHEGNGHASGVGGNGATAVAQRCAVIEPRHACAALKLGEADPERMLLKVAASLEANSTHPLALAVVRAAQDKQIGLLDVTEFVQEPGLGLRGMVEDQPVIVGSPALLESLCHTPTVQRLTERVAEVEAAGQTAVVVYCGGFAGILCFQDTLRADARAMVDQLHALNVRPLVMLTGDNQRAAEAVAREVGVDEVRAELLPEDKLREVEALVKAHQVVGMVGDGINDAPALARATVGIAMGSIGSDAAMQAADIVLLSDNIERLPWLVNTARRARTVMAQNLTFAIGVIVVLAVFSIRGDVPLSLGVIGHEGSTVLVVFNGLRLLMSRNTAA